MKSKKIPVDRAVGMMIPHDLTEIVPDKKKGPAFKKGHIIREEDIERLKDIGKEHIYCIELEEGEVHEDDAAIRIAHAVSGANIVWDENITEGKVGFKAGINGLFRVDKKALYELNLLGEIMVSTVHDATVVRNGQAVAAGRAIPLVIKNSTLKKMEEITAPLNGIIWVDEWRIKRASIIVTGREVFEGRVKDAFGAKMSEKLASFGITVLSTVLCPDNPEVIASEIRGAIRRGASLVLCTGGMSVDPDDVTMVGIRMAGSEDEVYGSPVLPGAMFLIAYIREGNKEESSATHNLIPVIGVPACGMFFKTTVLDLILPRVIAGEYIDRKKIASMGHGGFCLNCKKCHYPVCPFGKGGNVGCL